MVNVTKRSPKRYRKSTLPQKICLTCGRPFAWRKKWRKVWDDVKTCSERCKSGRQKSRRLARID